MPYIDYIVKSYDGLEIVTRTHEVPIGVKVRAKIVFVHGFSEHIAAYDEWFPPICEEGYEVTLYDARGHGKTAKTKADFGKSHEKAVMEDLEAIIENKLLDSKGNFEKDVPTILWGFSMGGGIILNYMVIGRHRESFTAYVATGPMILRAPATRKGLDGFKASLLPWFRNIIPNHTERVALSPDMCNNNPARQQEYMKDELRHYRTSVALMHDAIKRGERLLDPEFVKHIVDRPLLLNHGTDDKLCDYEATKKFYKEAPLTHKTLELYGDKPHELMQNMDEDVQEHRDKVLQWLDATLFPSGATSAATKTATNTTTPTDTTTAATTAATSAATTTATTATPATPATNGDTAATTTPTVAKPHPAVAAATASEAGSA